ncbi:protein kinase domain-containing protein [Actinocorallia populi]|uniref:protein kinase domain-containing protein n=1 Tax=Actinocorallia populi TaxID=2079200 RepID=UPI0018E52CDE|nr:protein kinase [Actinocorallia populi]
MRAGAELAGRYRLDEPVRRDGAGELWQGVDLFLGRMVTIRVPPADPPEDERSRAQALAHFQRESRAAVELIHPGIAPVQDVGEHEGRPFLVLEPWGSRDLGTELAREPRGLPISTVLDYGIQAADALAAAHSAGLVHGEVNPSCLLLSEDGTVKLCDFGIAVLRDPAKAGLLDERTDLHSLGVTIFCLLTGEGAGPAGRTPSARSLRRGILPELDVQLGDLLAGEPGRGPAKATEIAEMLQRTCAPYESRYRLRLLAEAERIAWSIPFWHHRMPVLRGIVEVLAEEDPAGAERLARTVTKPHFQASLLLTIAGRQMGRDPGRAEKLLTAVEALAYTASDPVFSRDGILRELADLVAAHDPAEAVRLVQNISSPYDKACALCDLAGTLAARDPGRAGELLLEAAALVATIPVTSTRIVMACRVSHALAERDPRLARELLADAERLARTDGSTRGGGWDGDQPPQNGWLAQIVGALAVQDPVAAERLARDIEDPAMRDTALEYVVEALSRHDPAAAERLARGIEGPSARDVALGVIVRALAVRDPAGAERLIGDIEDPDFRVTPWLDLVRAQTGRDPVLAERIARAIPDPESRAWRLRDVAEAVRAERPRHAEGLLAEAAELPLSTPALREIAGSLAALNPSAAERLARGLDDPAHCARALRDVASALTVQAPHRARGILAESEHLARTLIRPHDRDGVLGEIARSLAEIDPPEAERLAHTIGAPDQQASALRDIAATLACYDAAPARRRPA